MLRPYGLLRESGLPNLELVSPRISIGMAVLNQ